MAYFIERLLMTIVIVTIVCDCLPVANTSGMVDGRSTNGTSELEATLNTYIRNTIPVMYGRHFELVKVLNQVNDTLTMEIGLESAEGRYGNVRCTINVNVTRNSNENPELFSSTRANCTPAIYRIDNTTNTLAFDHIIVELESAEALVVEEYLRRNYSNVHLIRLTRPFATNQTVNNCDNESNYTNYSVAYFFYEDAQKKFKVCATHIKVDRRRTYKTPEDFNAIQNDNSDEDNDSSTTCSYLDAKTLTQFLPRYN